MSPSLLKALPEGIPQLFLVLRRITVFLAIGILAGCASQGGAPGQSSYDHGFSEQGAMGALLDLAIDAMEEGQLEEAGQQLSRALRINPVEPAVYYYMARLRQQQGDLGQARQLASRALSLGPSQSLESEIESLLTSLERM